MRVGKTQKQVEWAIDNARKGQRAIVVCAAKGTTARVNALLAEMATPGELKLIEVVVAKSKIHGISCSSEQIIVDDPHEVKG